MSEIIIEWDRIVHKNVRTNDNAPVENIVEVSNNSVIVTSQGARDEYSIPKSMVEAFNGAEVFLNIHSGQLRTFKV